MTSRGLSNEMMHAAFRTFDVDHMSIMNRYEYILCRASFNYNPERDSGTLINKYRQQMIFHLYDFDSDGMLEASELEHLITDLASGSTHIKRLMRDLGIQDATKITKGFS